MTPKMIQQRCESSISKVRRSLKDSIFIEARVALQTYALGSYVKGIQ